MFIFNATRYFSLYIEFNRSATAIQSYLWEWLFSNFEYTYLTIYPSSLAKGSQSTLFPSGAGTWWTENPWLSKMRYTPHNG
jgi:hypothetical protein